MSPKPRRKSISFKSNIAPEAHLSYPNPGRGWYRNYRHIVGQEVPVDEWRMELDPSESLALIMLDLCNYRQDKLDETALSNISQVLAFFAENDKELLLRFTYDSKGGALMNEPTVITTIMDHMSQVQPLLKQYQDIIFCIQGFFVGPWGEMHSSRFVTLASLKVLWAKMQEIAPEGCFFGVRKPSQWRSLEDRTGRLCLFNDGILGSDTDLGTYLPDELYQELDFVDELCQRVPNGGEVVAKDVTYTTGQELARLRKLHISFLNCTYDKAVLNRWKELSISAKEALWNGASVYDYVGQHLGYRFVVESVSLKKPSLLAKDKACQLNLSIKNSGYANLYQEAKLDLVFEASQESTFTQPIDADSRQWACNESCALSVELDEAILKQLPAEGCRLYLALARKKDGRPIVFANEGSDGRTYLGDLFYA